MKHHGADALNTTICNLQHVMRCAAAHKPALGRGTPTGPAALPFTLVQHPVRMPKCAACVTLAACTLQATSHG